MTKSPPVVLTVAGFDPSSGAGITADIKTIAAHGCYGVAAVTAMTVQSTLGVRRVEAVGAKVLEQTLSELASDMQFAAVHVGMLGSAESANAVADFLTASRAPNVVLDPVLRATSGTDLLDNEGLTVLLHRLIPLSAEVTPNLYEASVLTGIPVGNEDQMQLAAGKLHSKGAKAVVVTGGHLAPAADLLSYNGKSGLEQQFFRGERIVSNCTHGTGCAFACSIACHLAHGRTLPQAVSLAKAYVRGAIVRAYPIGRGIGPINHFFESDPK